MKTSAFEIKPYKNKIGGSTSFRVSGWLGTKRIRENFTLEADALTRKQNLEREALNLAPLPAITTRLTEAEAREAEAVYLRLKSYPALTLSVAVDYAIRNWTSPTKSQSIADAITLFIAAKTQANLRPASLKGLGVRLKRLGDTFGARQVSELTAEHIKPLIFREGSGNTNRDGDYRALTNFFNWTVKEGFREFSPMAKIGKITLDESEPVALTLGESRRLVHAAQNFKGGALVPYVVLCLFCGIRPDAEAARLTWDCIRLDSGIIRVGADVAKMRGRRTVEIPANAVEFLAPHALKKTPLKGKNWAGDFDRIKRLAGFGSPFKEHQPKAEVCYCAACLKERGQKLQDWTPDIMRHTAISYRLAQTNDEKATAAWAGNSPDVVHDKYKALIDDPAHVAEFWNIRPGTLAQAPEQLRDAA